MRPRVILAEELEDCFDGSVTYQFELDRAVDERLMFRLAQGGSIDYHPEFPRPYFRITQPHAWIVQGIIGNTSFRVTGSPSCLGDPAENLRKRIEEGDQENGSEIEAVL